MAQKSIEIILFRQLVTYLVMPSFIIDPDGFMIYWNDAAEQFLDFKFSERDETSTTTDWKLLFTPQDKNGSTLPFDKSPLFISSTQYRIACDKFYITNLQQKLKYIVLCSIPIFNYTDIYLGCIAFFQEIEA